MPDLPLDTLPPWSASRRREVEVYGVTVELVLLPERAGRPGRAGDDRPVFLPSPAQRIVTEEALWADAQLGLTPNRYPFAERQLILWSLTERREPDAYFLATMFHWCDEHGLSGLVNSIGAAASIPRAHAHLTPEQGGFLTAVPHRRLEADWLPGADGVEFLQADVPFCAIGVRGPAAARADAMVSLQEIRMTPAYSLVSHPQVTWHVPRTHWETPTPHFPHALGAAELWGRWCYSDASAFAEATARKLEQALVLSCAPPLIQP